jgi:cytochrome c-type biogenesis protein CcmH
MLVVLLGALAVAALLAVLLPLLRGHNTVVARASFDQAVYRDQLDELDRDVARGLIGETEAAGARLEIQRRLLATTVAPPIASPLASPFATSPVPPKATAPPAQSAAVPASRRSPVLAAILACLMAAGAAGLYARLGAPAVPDVPYASRGATGDLTAQDGPLDMRRTAGELAQKLAHDPTDAQAWLMLARADASLGQWDKAADAFRRAMDLGQTAPEVQAGYGEMLVMQAQGVVTPAAHDAFAAVLARDARNDVARYYLALAAGQAGEPGQAIQQWQALAADLPPGSRMRTEVEKHVAEAARQAGVAAPALAPARTAATAPGPDEATIAQAQAMPEADRRAMISGMVARLADRLKSQPGDFDGWMRLGRAYGVLKQTDKAADAFEHAAALHPDDVAPRLLIAEALLTNWRPSDPLPSRALVELRKVQLVSPDEPTVLWYLGVAAVRDGHKDEARAYWGKLLAKLPPDGADAGMVRSALQAVQGS